VFYFFQYHRHLGLDIYLITQNEKLLPLQLVTLSEFVIHSQPRSTSIIGELKYVVKISGENVDRKVLKPKQEIFDLYCSMSNKEVEKVSNPFKKYAIACIALLLIGGYVFKSTFIDFAERGKEREKTALEKWKEKNPGKTHPSEQQAEKDLSKHLQDQKNMGSGNGNVRKFVPVSLSYILNSDKSITVVHPTRNVLIPLTSMEWDCDIAATRKGFLITTKMPKDEYDAYIKTFEESSRRENNYARATSPPPP